MDHHEYAEFEARVADFFSREGVVNLTPGHLYCPECGVKWADEKCPKCGINRESADAPYFSWRRCECCGDRLGGDREHATGYNPKTGGIQTYSVCPDCIYYVEHGQLDDTTMMHVENSRERQAC